MHTRRNFLKLGLLGAAAFCLPKRPLRAHPDMPMGFLSPTLTPFVDALRIPSLLRPRRVGRVDNYTLTMKAGTTQCHRDLPLTNIIGYNGLYPGPIIRAIKGRTVAIKQINNLPPAHHGHLPTVHLHGALVAPEHDGHPNDVIPAGASRTYTYPNQQKGCALWYHDHTHGATGENVYHGLAGLYFVDDPKERALRLPRGPYEVPLILQDRLFTNTGQLQYHIDAHVLEFGFIGDVLMVNGVAQPFFRVATRKYRFRILNGSNARIYKLAMSNGQPLVQIGTDGGLLQRPKYLDSIEIAPSERADVIIDFTNVPLGTSLVLQNLNGLGKTASIMRFDIVKKERDNAIIPPFLMPWEELPEEQAVPQIREFTLNRITIAGQLTWVINNQPYDSANPPLATPKLNTIEKWKFINPTAHPHPMHVHLVQFQIVNIDGEPQEASDFGWKDTFLVQPNSEVTVMAKFSGYTGRYVFHCHNLEHEDFAMMGELEVVP